MDAFHDYVDSIIMGMPNITVKALECGRCPMNSVCNYKYSAPKRVLPRGVDVYDYVDPINDKP